MKSAKNWIFAIGLLLGGAARAERMAAAPFLIDASLGIGIEPVAHTGGLSCNFGGPDAKPQCGQMLTFGVGAEALWRGLVGGSVALYASQGRALLVAGMDDRGRPLPGYGDRVSTVVAAAVRPLAPLAWSYGDGFLPRLAAGFGLQVGISWEHARTALESANGLGLHAAALLDVPLWRSNTEGGLSLRLAARLFFTREGQFIAQPDGSFLAVTPGTGAQLLVGLAYYL